MKRFLAIALMLSLSFLAKAQDDTAGVIGTKHFRLRYAINTAEIDSSFVDNSDEILTIQEFLTGFKNNPHIKIQGVEFRGTASPDGSYEFNVWLSENRLKSFKKFVNSYIPVPDSLISAQSSEIPWDEFRNKVAESTLPMRDQILRIIDGESKFMPYPGNRHIDSRLLELKELQDGEVWESLKPVLSDLRYGDAVFHYKNSWRVVNELSSFPVAKAEVKALPYLKPREVAPSFPADTVRWLPRIYLKTNLIGWAAGSTNLGVEFDLAPHWSFSLPVYYCAWDYIKSTIKFRNFTIQPEFRWWPQAMSKGVNDGFFAGAHFGAMAFNFASDGKYRYQDRGGTHPALGGGFSTGYRKPMSKDKRWHLEFSAGVGMYHLDYDVYENTGDYKEGEWVRSKKKSWIGLDNAAISITYNFGQKKRERIYIKEGGK